MDDNIMDEVSKNRRIEALFNTPVPFSNSETSICFHGYSDIFTSSTLSIQT